MLDEPRVGDDETWLSSAFDASRNWVILVLPWPGQTSSTIAWLQRRIAAGGGLPTTLIFVLPPALVHSVDTTALEAIGGPARFATTILRGWPSSGPALAMGDASDVRLRYAERTPILQFSGESLAAEWLGIIQALPSTYPDGIPSEPGEDPLRRLRISRNTTLIQEKVTLGVGPEARSVAGVLDELRGFEQSLLTAIVDPELLVRGIEAPDSDTSSGLSFDRQRPLGQQLPLLSDNCDALCHHLSLSPVPPAAFWTRLAGHDLLPTIAAVLTEPTRRSVAGEIHILSNRLSESMQWSSVADPIRNAVIEFGWVVHIGFPKSSRGGGGDPAERMITSLRALVPSPRLRLWALDRPAPVHALVIDDLIFLAGGDWVPSTFSQELDTADFGLAIESRDFAESLRTCFVGAAEVLLIPNR